MTDQRQTISFLKQRFADVGLRPDSRHGQSFLIDLNLLDILVGAGELTKEDLVLEVGTGTGALTSRLVQEAGFVLSVEIDAYLHQMASEELFGRTNVELLQQDVLKNKNQIHKTVLDRIAERLASPGISKFKLVANLPYSIATPLVSNLLHVETVPDRMVVTIQKELADRMVAVPSTKDYGALSVWVQSVCHVEVLRILPPTVFWPRPKVHSAIVVLVPDEAKRRQIPEIREFHALVRALFRHRRKFLRSNLLSALKDRLGKPEVDQIMRQRDLGPDSRSEQLSVEDFRLLYLRVRDALLTAKRE
jgi:16S rRNA (adenine1518-N6/adenine1519-N6)-dimethyltransferase